MATRAPTATWEIPSFAPMARCADGAVRRAGVGRGQGRQGGAFVGERGAGLVADTHRQFGVAGPADRFKGLLRGRIHDTTSLVTFTYQPW
ncbi:hypothetical protein ADK84_13720 [Streptomyces sp. NRRL WC-3701]|nr:hypothetical protein ADK84_13720 [Streptomyces sp. NRRL WC-3701]